jgi:Xaa-Pro dipeptidase
MIGLLPTLTVDGCQARQERLRRLLQARGIAGALLCDRRHVHYFTGFWCRAIYSPMALIEADGPTSLSAPYAPRDEVAADHAHVYEGNRLCTLVDDQLAAALKPLAARLSNLHGIGCDGLLPVLVAESHEWADLRPDLCRLRRAKDQDEVSLIAFAVAAVEAAYRYAYEVLRPDITEVQLFAGMHAAIAEHVGESIGEIGNDFQIGSPVGPPRRRPAEAGEIAVLDVSVVVRGYASDLSRSFVVGRKPSEQQLQAYRRVAETLAVIESTLRPGVRCAELYRLASEMLEGYGGWKFGHHLGHGIGLCQHEAPRLNPNWNDVLDVGDVFTVEPGLYGDTLRAGIRIEQNYHLSPAGLVRLSNFPTEMA